MNIPAQMHQIRLIPHQPGLKPLLKQPPHQAILLVKHPHVPRQQRPHRRTHRPVPILPHQQMKMVIHQTIRHQRQPVPLAILIQSRQKIPPVKIIPKNHLLVIPAIIDMVVLPLHKLPRRRRHTNSSLSENICKEPSIPYIYRTPSSPGEAAPTAPYPAGTRRRPNGYSPCS
jgi:hypothetical protein